MQMGCLKGKEPIDKPRSANSKAVLTGRVAVFSEISWWRGVLPGQID